MPRRKGHSIPPTKKVRIADAGNYSEEKAIFKTPEKSEGDPVIPSSPTSTTITAARSTMGAEAVIVESRTVEAFGADKYLHKKFKKIATTVHPQENSPPAPAPALGAARTPIPSPVNGFKVKSLLCSVPGSTEPTLGVSVEPQNSKAHDAGEAAIGPGEVAVGPGSGVQNGRYICPYCKLACAKPSVLQKHIRAHTNERPYPCHPCGFAFKTKSNLYKHCRSRAHTLKMEEDGHDAAQMEPLNEDDIESSTDDEDSPKKLKAAGGRLASPESKRDEPMKTIYKPKFHTVVEAASPTKGGPAPSPLALSIPSSPQLAESPSPGLAPVSLSSASSPSPEFLQRHISKLISENQAIVETMDPFWPKKYMQRSVSKDSKDSSASSLSSSSSSPGPESWSKTFFNRSSGADHAPESKKMKPVPKQVTESKLALALLRPNATSSKAPETHGADSAQPLNLTVNNCVPVYAKHVSEAKPEATNLTVDQSEKVRKSPLNHINSSAPAHQSSQVESSSIKDILLKARGTPTSVFKATNSSQEKGDMAFINPKNAPSSTDSITSGSNKFSSLHSQQFACSFCKVAYRSADDLEIHNLYYCKKNGSTLRLSPNPYKETNHVESRISNGSSLGSATSLTSLSQPSPGPLLGKTPLVNSYHPETAKVNVFPSLPAKEISVPSLLNKKSTTTTLKSLEELCKSPMRPNSMQAFNNESHTNDDSEVQVSKVEVTNRGAMEKYFDSEKFVAAVIPSFKRSKTSKENAEFLPSSVSPAKLGAHPSGSHPGLMITDGLSLSSSSNISRAKSPSYEPAQKNSLGQDFRGAQPHLDRLVIPIIPKILTQDLTQSSAIPASISSVLPPSPLLNPLTTITAFNPLTLPINSLLQKRAAIATPQEGKPNFAAYNGGLVTILHGGKSIPFVPGMPGPHSFSVVESKPLNLAERMLSKTGEKEVESSLSSKRSAGRDFESDLEVTQVTEVTTVSISKRVPLLRVESSDDIILENKAKKPRLSVSSPSPPSGILANSSKVRGTPEPLENTTSSSTEDSSNTQKQFLRPTSLPLKPGTFALKKSTPLGSTVLPLVSPETPRPSKSYGQLYLNGNAYTYLGLKCSTRTFFCTLNKPQPIYVPLSTLSMYSNWKVCSEAGPNPFGLNPGKAMSFYDSRHRQSSYTVARTKCEDVVTHSSYWLSQSKSKESEANESVKDDKSKKTKGVYESSVDYIYIRGRGRGPYVCEECGIRCKKPSMLKKHIRTHTDTRPYTCKHCAFSFKTKGNLTKHMKSKAHYKKCVELGISPVPTAVDESNIDQELLAKQQELLGMQSGDNEESEEDSDEDLDEEDDDEDEFDDEDIMNSDNKNKLEREAVSSLLSLSEVTIQAAVQSKHVLAGLLNPSNRPFTYPYNFCLPPRPVSEACTPTLTSISAHREHEKVSQNTGLARELQPSNPVVDCGRSDDVGLAACNKTSHYYFPSIRDTADLSMEEDSSQDEEMAVTTISGPIDLSRSKSNNNNNLRKLSTSSLPSRLSISTHSPLPADILTTVSEPALLLATLCSSMERLPVTNTVDPAEEAAMLQVYLKEKAMQDLRMKQMQYQTALNSKISNKGKLYAPTLEKDSKLESQTGFNIELTSSREEKKSAILDSILKSDSLMENNGKFMNEPRNLQQKIFESVSSVYEKALDSVKTVNSVAKENALDILAHTTSEAKKSSEMPSVSSPSKLIMPKKLKAEFKPPSCGPSSNYVSVLEDGRSMCVICNKIFSKPSQLRLHLNIHYFERPFRCESCAVSFRTKGHLQKHQRSVSHTNKVSMNSTFGAATSSNPRPFKCDDCKIAFRIHGHLAKHLRSKMHIMKLECLGKLPFGTYAEMERSGINMNDIDTTDCENFLESLQLLAQKL
ncbi:unnamed protein product [Bemisia tabaci]|uniref:C2H2-type domain-containing protein n=1 Tax=Bemisia tabaci TaxID=7038 RepID=A0A9P0CAG0_BEMTA|nr:unnamed protein product [Bemisia tabaci]